MGRPSLESNEVYMTCLRRMEPLKNVVEEAKKQAELDVIRAQKRVEDEMLEILRWGIDRNLSQYAIGKLTGKTRAEDQRRLMDMAKGINWMPEVEERMNKDTVVIKVGEFEARVTGHSMNAWNRVESDWVFSHPDFEDEALWFEGVDETRWPADSAMRDLWVDGYEWGDPRYADLNELVRQVQRWQP